MEMLVFGHGYSAGYLTPLLTARGWNVTGTTREHPERVAAAGARPLIWPGAEDSLRQAIARADAILVSAGPGPEGDPVLAQFRADLAQARPGWLGYLSTTGVYGDRQGGWVDEDSELDGSGPRGKARIRAEADWQALARENDLPLHIFRLAGIYGPGRGPFAKLRRGSAKRTVKPGQVFSRIHVEDIAQTLLASIDAPDPIGIYNLCDDEPAPPQDVIAHAAMLLGMDPPPEIPFEEAAREMSPMARSFYADSKRVSNVRIKERLGVALKYPGYDSGLRAILRAEG
ncbi:SDR family oxidoreductase [Paracoccus sp. 1_MG-2023]|uniref:SDR family oxidoreductase n=1 Tax=unclassified Paracoccus (in: a-proteobacteria) TaxID=2688777 RepID=UPI001C0A549D|nr:MULTISPECIES: SDR family oxidoreductase [unclassified Paracoccus (in: a-proteobacteria)]MBU2957272.1 SDR family oxidoreductase [Paracoccus sp. C2R09]MDO6669159.1 SDR family oxidoreductase [Paracoccus sp. 1_MG-2023]